MALQPASDLRPATRWLLLVALALTVLHHVDHVMRVDHSGWPFRPAVTPFTYSLLAYPMILFALFGAPRWFWLRWGLLLAGTLATLAAHTLMESPQMQYAMWAQDRSIDPHGAGLHNLVGLRSSAMGWLAVIVSMALNVTAVTATVAVLADRLRARY